MQHEYSGNEQGIHNPDPGNTNCENRSSQNDMVMERVIDKTGFDSQQENEIFISSKTTNNGCGAQTVS